MFGHGDERLTGEIMQAPFGVRSFEPHSGEFGFGVLTAEPEAEQEERCCQSGYDGDKQECEYQHQHS
jgi:hypothetical protein